MIESPDASDDAVAERRAASRREIKFGAMLEGLIERGGYIGNRKRISSRLGISPAALSQYIREQTRPTFDKLLAIADFFDVSLDYLVYGQPTGSIQVDYGPLYRYFDHALADVQARGSRRDAVAARIGRMLAERISTVAEDLAAQPTATREGLLQDDELLKLEAYCTRCDLLSLNLEFDIRHAESELVPGRFLFVVAANLGKGVRYRIILPHDQQWDTTVDAFRRLLADRIGGDQVRESCTIRVTSAPVLTGLLLYELDTVRLEAEEPELHAQIHDYLSDDVWLGCVIRPNGDSNSDMLMDGEHVRRARQAFDQMWSASHAVLPRRRHPRCYRSGVKPGVVVGRVIQVRPHPGGIRIWLADVDIGTGDKLQIVWGGLPIVKAGHLVPVAPPGAWLPPVKDKIGPYKIRRRRYRGVVSHGMLCSLAELGWDSSITDWVALLDDSVGLKVGDPLDERFVDGRDVVMPDVFDLVVRYIAWFSARAMARSAEFSQERTRRAMASDASLTFSVASGPPSSMACATQ